ncbi:hypothetical protein EUX98_g3066 [Antrodiella citrinella]|uniref:Arrestin C-terminal-like domain-containing protein n=1 Tax=Antrodiella citrinella TaxID=2447956 RepID=A0A4S4MXF4_9APHY|nr:hypothetical protein EUX98_g3066 [Antrodiella citrinella]
MSSQAKLTLRPPPNIDFVQGYPGIPPGPPDRPQAAVKGAIEVRVGPQGVKAKWVRIELRKIETLPGGGLTNTFFDFVGQSPISLWQSGEEYSTLSSQDFPFQIRIPESIPPSIALEKGAGVKYELIATLCIKGKKGFLKRDKQNIIATSSPIIIDKHELHSTWPVYSQPEGRRLTQEGVTLTVERSHTCFGPGDRIFANAIVRSDSLSTVILRGFEFSLRETTVFRVGPHMTGKKGAPQVRVMHVGEQKVPVNATLYGGTQHKAELSVTVPSHHTTTTLNAARHIDITYVLIVKALMATGKPLVIDLPVIISNWPRAVSVEAVRRIGLAASVQAQPQGIPGSVILGPPTSPQTQIGQQIVPTTSPISPSATQPRPSLNNVHPFQSLNERPGTANSDNLSSVRFNTSPAMNGSAGGSAYRNTADEFGFHSSAGLAAAEVLQISGSAAAAVAASSASNSRPVASDTSSTSGGNTNTTGTGLRARTSDRAGTSAANRLTVTNFADDMPEEAASQAAAVAAAAAQRSHQRQTSSTTRQNTLQGGQGSSSRSNAWLPAEEEKRRLYERAVADVERVQGGLGSPPPTGHTDAGRVIAANDIISPVASAPAGSSSSKWMTAEEEKARLFNDAQAAARRLQGIDPPSTPPAAGGSSSNQPASAPMSPQLTGAALYAQAMAGVNRNASAGNSSTANSSGRKFPTAEEEKAEMKRYNEAKAAVERSQYGIQDGSTGEPPASAPISYEALYGPGSTAPSSKPSQQSNGHAAMNGYANSPRSFSGEVTSPMSAFDALSEKDRLKKAYETQDAVAFAAALRSPAASTINNVPMYPQSAVPPYAIPAASGRPVSPPGPPTTPPMQMQAPAGPMSAISEKEQLRLRYEAQDASAAAVPPAPYTPPMGQMANGGAGGLPPTPPPRTRTSPGGGSLRGAGGGSLRGALPNPRTQPNPPSSSSQPLSAAEEKARLRAMYEAQDAPQPHSTPSPPPPSQYGYVPQQSPPGVYSSPAYTSQPSGVNSNGNAHLQRSDSVTMMNTPPPPPLAPRPPREYIDQTKEEDARTAAKIQAIDSVHGLVSPNGNGTGIGAGPELTMNPFTPFTPGFDIATPRPPPMPTKVSTYDG